MREQLDSTSLLSYLAPGKGGAGLQIALLNLDSSTLAPHHPFPFLLISDADPLTRLIKAAFVTDSGSRIKDVFLLVQRDDYSLPPSQMAPLTNLDIEDSWQKTYQYQCQRHADSPPISLQQQLDHQGRLIPFEPLLFCTNPRAFFHPPCPACGAPLQLCSNDQLLASLGLPKYSLSLKRYLFCPTCLAASRDTTFYALRKSASDPPLVKDCADLVRAFGQLVQDSSLEAALPCTACPENGRCFGPAAAAPPIVPFSFYPFHLLIAEAMSMSGLDFTVLLAGASLEELAGRLEKAGEGGRAAYLRASAPEHQKPHSFLFAGDARLFLEILYLKLSLLELIVAELFPHPEENRPDPVLFMDRIWVKLGNCTGLQPYLWNFEAHYLDLVRNPLDLPAHPPMPPAYACHLLGLIWFTVLLTNRKQEVSQVHRAVEKALRSDPSIPDNLVGGPGFLPENIFWNPVLFELDEGWRRFWEEALRIGWSLFRSEARDGVSDFKEELTRTLEDLRASIKGEMFSKEPARENLSPAAEAEAIHGILSRLMTKRHQSTVVQPEEEWEETLVIPTEPGFETTLPPGEGSRIPPDDAAATVVLTTPEARQRTGSAMEEEIFQETVILSGKRLRETFQPETAPPPRTADELSETVILGARGVGGVQEGAPPSGPAPATSAGAEKAEGTAEELAETMILASSSKPKPGEEDELLSATIILPPSKDRDKK